MTYFSTKQQTQQIKTTERQQILLTETIAYSIKQTVDDLSQDTIREG